IKHASSLIRRWAVLNARRDVAQWMVATATQVLESDAESDAKYRAHLTLVDGAHALLALGELTEAQQAASLALTYADHARAQTVVNRAQALSRWREIHRLKRLV